MYSVEARYTKLERFGSVVATLDGYDPGLLQVIITIGSSDQTPVNYSDGEEIRGFRGSEGNDTALELSCWTRFLSILQRTCSDV